MRYRYPIIILTLILGKTCITGCHPTSCDLEREERLVAYYHNRENSPSEFRAKMVNDPYWVRLREMVPGRSLRMSRQQIRKELMRLEQEIYQGCQWKTPIPQAIIPFAETAPVIDGNLQEEIWNEALSYQGEYPLNSEHPRDSNTEWYLLYDQHFIYFGARILDISISPGPKETPYKGDSVELFLHPDKRLTDYLETVVSCNGSVYNARASQSKSRHYDLERCTIPGLAASTKRFPGGYSVEVRIPFSALPGYLLGNAPRPGDSMNFMMIRCNLDDQGNFSRTTPVPFLYDGHNIYGYIQGLLAEPKLSGQK